MIAGCWNCHWPLVSTFMIRKKEFYCINCGSSYAFFSPMGLESTPQMEELMHKVKEEFKTLSEGVIADGVYYTTCEKCGAGEYHIIHATDEEIAADEAARRRLDERAKAHQLI